MTNQDKVGSFSFGCLITISPFSFWNFGVNNDGMKFISCSYYCLYSFIDMLRNLKNDSFKSEVARKQHCVTSSNNFQFSILSLRTKTKYMVLVIDLLSLIITQKEKKICCMHHFISNLGPWSSVKQLFEQNSSLQSSLIDKKKFLCIEKQF